MIVVAITNRKKKFRNVFTELHVQTENKWKKKMIILNDEIQINCMSESLTQAWRLKIISRFVVKVKIFQIDVTHFVNAYEIMIRLRDDASREHIST